MGRARTRLRATEKYILLLIKSLCCHFADAACSYIDIKGTFHEELAEEIMQYARKKFKDMLGEEGKTIQYQDIWRGKAKLVIGQEFENGI